MQMEHFFPQIQVKTKKRSSSKIEHFIHQIQVKTKKKRKVFIRNRTLFSPTFAQMYCTPIQIIGEIYPPHPPLFRHPWFLDFPG